MITEGASGDAFGYASESLVWGYDTAKAPGSGESFSNVMATSGSVSNGHNREESGAPYASPRYPPPQLVPELWEGTTKEGGGWINCWDASLNPIVLPPSCRERAPVLVLHD